MTDEGLALNNPPLNPPYAVVNRNALSQLDEPAPPSYSSMVNSLINTHAELPLGDTRSLPAPATSVTQPTVPNASKNPFAEDIRPSLPPSNVLHQLPAEIASRVVNSPVQVIEKRPKPFWESGESSFEDWQQSSSQQYYDSGEAGQVANDAYQETEYYEYQDVPKKKGFFKKLMRSVQKMSSLGASSRNLPPAYCSTDGETAQPPASTQNTSVETVPRPLTAEDLALHDRYSNPLHCAFISLEASDHTHPSDVRIHHEMNRIYVSDVGRSVIEIFDVNGHLLHTINDPAMLNCQPNRFVITPDGTLIISSAIHHCLYMYSPTAPLSDHFQYQQFKLGAAGKLIHQFYSPSDLTVDPSNGYIFVCDVGNYRIKVLTPEGVCERIIQLVFLNPRKQYLCPTAITYQPTRNQLICIVNNEDAICFVSKHANGRTYVEPKWIVDENGVALQGASSLAIDRQERIFIADTLNHRIVICTAEGSYITNFGTNGPGPGQLEIPRGIAINHDGSVIVADLGNRRVQIFGASRETAAANQTADSNGHTSDALVETNNDLVTMI